MVRSTSRRAPTVGSAGTSGHRGCSESHSHWWASRDSWCRSARRNTGRPCASGSSVGPFRSPFRPPPGAYPSGGSQLPWEPECPHVATAAVGQIWTRGSTCRPTPTRRTPSGASSGSMGTRGRCNHTKRPRTPTSRTRRPTPRGCLPLGSARAVVGCGPWATWGFCSVSGPLSSLSWLSRFASRLPGNTDHRPLAGGAVFVGGETVDPWVSR